MTTIHSYTGDQPTLDRRHKDLRARRLHGDDPRHLDRSRQGHGRSAAGTAGKLDGTAIRVPTPNVSAVDLTFQAAKSVTRSGEVNELCARPPTATWAWSWPMT